MLDIHRSLKRPRQDHDNSSLVFSSKQDSEGEFLPLQDQVCELLTPATNSTAKPLFTRPIGRLVEDRGSILGTIYFGPTSLESLMLDFQDSMSSRIDTDFQESKDTGLSIHDTINSLVDTRYQQHLSGAPSPTEPPLVILECMMEPYFANINPHIPIWSRDGFQEIVTSLRQHSVCPEDKWASIVCCNNLILVNLTADSLHSNRRKMAQSGSSENIPSMTCDLIAGFLSNAKRAIENLGLLSPRLINLQALLSLQKCIVAQQHLPLHILDFLFAQAVRCAEGMGIFQWHRLRERLTESEFQDYRNIAHCLYVLDKQVCWTASVPPRILKSELQLDLNSSDGLSRKLAIKAELASIEETIFFHVYAGDVKARTEEEVRDFVEHINQRLDGWLVKLGIDVEATSRQPESYPVQAGLLFSSLCARLLLIWPFKEHSDAFFQQHHSIAATSVRLLLAAWQSSLGTEQHVSVPLLITSYPPLYLLGICSGILTSSGSESEKNLLRSFAKLLKAIVGSRQDVFYTKRVEEVSLTLVDAVTALGAPAKRHRTASSAECLSRPSSSYHAIREQNASRQVAACSDERSLVYTGIAGLDQQYAAGSGSEFPHCEDSAKFKMHTTSRDSDGHLVPAYQHIGTGEDYSEELFSYLAFTN